jgi:hypothetical protein
MNMSLPVTATKTPRPPRILLYGPGGVGKTTLATQLPGALFLPVEEGADMHDVARLPRPANWTEALALIDQVAAEPSGYKALVIDTVTTMQQLCIQQVCETYNVRSIEEVGGGYGKGWRPAYDLWMSMLDRLEVVRSRGLAIVLIGHLEIRRYDDPRSSGYDRFQPRLQKDILAGTFERCDGVFCAAYKVYTDSEDKGFNKVRTRAVGSGERVLYTDEQPTHLAKNRWALPSECPMSWGPIFAGIAAAFAPKQVPAASAA